jgi:hypothetical protein
MVFSDGEQNPTGDASPSETGLDLALDQNDAGKMIQTTSANIRQLTAAPVSYLA